MVGDSMPHEVRQQVAVELMRVTYIDRHNNDDWGFCCALVATAPRVRGSLGRPVRATVRAWVAYIEQIVRHDFFCHLLGCDTVSTALDLLSQGHKLCLSKVYGVCKQLAGALYFSCQC
jgi:hypothetical protein